VTGGNRHDHAESIKIIEPIDAAMAEIYAARSGQDPKNVAKLMDATTYMPSAQAVELGFADSILADDAGAPPPPARAGGAARHQLDLILAKHGMPRAERRRLLRDASNSTGTPGAADAPATRDAGLTDAVAAELRRLLANLRT